MLGGALFESDWAPQAEREASPEAHVVLCTLGTLGDVLPFAAIARALTRRGANVEMLANENWAGLARSAGASFTAIAPEDPPQDKRNDFAFFRRNVLPSFEASYSHLARLHEAGQRPTVGYRSGMLGALCAAERLDLDGARFVLQPSAIRSFQRPPWPLTQLVHGPLSTIGPRYLVPAAYRAGELFSRYRRHTDAFRASKGLERIPLGAEPSNRDPTLVLCPRWFCMPQPDWPRSCEFLGFPFEEDEAPPRRAERGQLVFTPGTGRVGVDSFRRSAATGRGSSRRSSSTGPP